MTEIQTPSPYEGEGVGGEVEAADGSNTSSNSSSKRRRI